MKHPGLHNLITSAITEFQAYQRTVHFNIFDSGFNNRKTRERGRRVCVGQCRNKKFESQLTSNILSPIPGNNGPFDCARLVLALSSRGCCTLLSLPLVQLFFSSSFSPFLFLLKPFRGFLQSTFSKFDAIGSYLSRDVVWKSWRRRLNIFALYKLHVMMVKPIKNSTKPSFLR